MPTPSSGGLPNDIGALVVRRHLRAHHRGLEESFVAQRFRCVTETAHHPLVDRDDIGETQIPRCVHGSTSGEIAQSLLVLVPAFVDDFPEIWRKNWPHLERE